MSVDRRLNRLEAAAHAIGVRRPCPACGGAPGASDNYVLMPIDLDEPTPVPGPDSCPSCGRRLVLRLGEITLDER